MMNAFNRHATMKIFGSRLPLIMTAICLSLPVGAAEFDCLIKPRQVVDIRPASQGIIEKVHVQRGDQVKAGQVLVTLDAGYEQATAELAKYRSTMKGAIRSSESRVEYSTLKHGRREKLVAQNYVSAQDRDEAATEKRLAEAELMEAKDNQRVAEYEYKRAQEQLRLRTVKSPFNGIVVDRLMHPGELADTSDNRKVILKLADISMLHVEALLPVEAFKKVTQGAEYEVFPEQPIGGKVMAKAKVIDKVLDPGSGTFGVLFEIPNKNFELPAGIKCKVSISGVTGGTRSGAGVSRERKLGG